MDDDNYMILPSLLQLLSSYHHSQDVYLGRPSLDHPIEAAEKVNVNGRVSHLVEIYLHCKDQWSIYEKINIIPNQNQESYKRIDGTSVSFQTPVKFWFATGGAGFCISRGLALKMSPWTR